jgi:hypothetical protein
MFHSPVVSTICLVLFLFTDGVLVEAIYLPAELTSRPLYLCQHPSFGLSWTFFGVDLNRSPSLWRPLCLDSTYDSPMGFAQYMVSHRLLLHEIRSERYSFEQFRDDIVRRNNQQQQQ